MKTLVSLLIAANLAFVATAAVATPNAADTSAADVAAAAQPAYELVEFAPTLIMSDVVVDDLGDRMRYTFAADAIVVEGATTVAAVAR